MKEKRTVYKVYKVLGLLAGSCWLLASSCHNGQNNDNTANNSETTNANVTPVAIPPFSADTAYYFTKKQVDFGPRVPGTKAHQNCLDFIFAELTRDSLHPVIQRSKARTFDGKRFEIENIIASSQPQNHVRILLCTHWDTRPWADMDTVDSDKPFDGADDGASGVGVMLEIARQLKNSKDGMGVDLVFFDLEDYGQQEGVNGEDTLYPRQENTWCLGSQYWASNLPAGYIMPRYGILLDMVGGKNAIFPMEGTSLKYAPQVVEDIWNTAAKLGYGNYFTHDKTIQTIDDHLYINKLAEIPTIDIVHYVVEKRDYPYFHHKHSDNMDDLDKSSMQMVGNLLLNIIYAPNSENP